LFFDVARVTGLGSDAAATGDMDARMVSVVPVSVVPVSVVDGEGMSLSGEVRARTGVENRFREVGGMVSIGLDESTFATKSADPVATMRARDAGEITVSRFEMTIV
jgi:hypothetical protein